MKSTIQRLSTMVLAAILAGCAGTPPTRAPDSPTLWPQGLACLEALGRSGVVFEPAADRGSASGCWLTNGVTLLRMSAAVEPSATITCPLAAALVDFEARVLQPAAVRHFGRRIAAIRNWGAYSCRSRNGNSKRLSEHAFGRALDIGAFDVAGGGQVSVKEHWRERGPRGQFLREIARGACDVFNVVLTPDSDRAHHDHLHFDIGPYRLCVK